MSDPKPVVTVRIRDTRFATKRGFAFRRDVEFVRRECIGYNFVEEEIAMIGADDALEMIVNLHTVNPGKYLVDICNVRRDWETGQVDDYDFELIAVAPEATP